MIAVVIFSILTVFFWAAFEQAAGTLPLYTRDFTQRTLEGSWATIFKVTDLSDCCASSDHYLCINRLFRKTFDRISLSNIFLDLVL